MYYYTVVVYIYDHVKCSVGHVYLTLQEQFTFKFLREFFNFCHIYFTMCSLLAQTFKQKTFIVKA